MKRTTTALWLSIAALSILPGLAGLGAEKVYTLQDCISTAMQKNADVLTGRNDVTAAKSAVTSTRSDYLPQLSLETNALTWNSTGVLTKTTNGTAFTVTENLFDGGLREAKVESAVHGASKQSAALSRMIQTVTYNVSAAYYEVLRARHLEEVAEANVRYDEGLRDQVKARADEGAAANVDILPLEAQLASARVSLLSAKNKVRTSTIELERLIGMTPETGFEIQDIDGSSSPAEISPLEDLVRQGLSSRPDVKQYEEATKSTKASVKQARINMYPRPTVSAEYQRQVSGGFTVGGTQLVGGIVFNIFDGGANRAAYKQAKVSQNTAELQERQLDKDIRSDVEEAFLTLTNAVERISANQVSLQSAEKNYSAQKERYSQGLGTTLDLLNAEVQLITAQSDEVEARYDYYSALAQMDYATGK